MIVYDCKTILNDSICLRENNERQYDCRMILKDNTCLWDNIQ